jgi:hypothetical protein
MKKFPRPIILRMIFSGIIFLIAPHAFGQKKAVKEESITGANIDIKVIEKREKNGDIEFLENNKKKKKVENEHAFESSHNLPVPQKTVGNTFKVNFGNTGENLPSQSALANPDTKINKGISFPAIIDNNRSIPPDCAGAVGPDHIMTALNTEIKIQNKKGDSLLQVSLDNFFFPITGVRNVFDPKLLYDKYEKRWIITAACNSNSADCKLLIAYSESDDPLGKWKGFSYKVDHSGKRWFDYPSIGINKNWIAVSGNMFDVRTENDKITGKAVTASNCKIYVFDKMALYQGSGTVSSFNLSSKDGFTICPVVTQDNTTATLYMVSLLNSSYSGKAYYQLYTLTGSPKDPEYTMTNLRPNVNFTWSDISRNNADFGPQLSVANLIHNGDARVQNAVYQNGFIWGTHTAFLPASNPTHSAVLWWQINATNAAIKQFGKIEDGAAKLFYAFPSIAVNKMEDVLVGYASFSVNQYGSSNYSFKSRMDPANTMNAGFQFKNGANKYYKTYEGDKNRWGDYTSTCLDTDELSFWTLQEYAENPREESDRWGTQWKFIKPD